ncbi:MAG: nucleotidyltransferase family protein [Magnetococcales bacterium]|nr:nucleotidyltransferase family protein [Magnetococcales bacterium]MBF0261938.1 nucleotidyltransferase family protein [Magnetococcales bacterium]
MERSRVAKLLGEHRAYLRHEFGVTRLALFGSTSRDEAEPRSDVDVLVEFEGRTTAKGYFGVLAYLEDLLGVEVDLATQAMIRPELRSRIERDLRDVA